MRSGPATLGINHLATVLPCLRSYIGFTLRSPVRKSSGLFQIRSPPISMNRSSASTGNPLRAACSRAAPDRARIPFRLASMEHLAPFHPLAGFGLGAIYENVIYNFPGAIFFQIEGVLNGTGRVFVIFKPVSFAILDEPVSAGRTSTSRNLLLFRKRVAVLLHRQRNCHSEKSPEA